MHVTVGESLCRNVSLWYKCCNTRMGVHCAVLQFPILYEGWSLSDNSDIVIWQIHCGILQYISDSLYRMVSLWHNTDIVNLHGMLQYRSPSPPSQGPSPLLTCPMAGRRDWTQTHGGTTTSTTTRAPPSGSHLSLKQVSHRGNPSQRVYLCFEQFNQKCS